MKRVRDDMGFTNVKLMIPFCRRVEEGESGSNDLTQLTLGVDRDSELVAFDYEERDEGVKEMIRLAVEGCKRNGRHSGICGQAPSDYPEMAEYLVRLGIDSMSLNHSPGVKVPLLEWRRLDRTRAQPRRRRPILPNLRTAIGLSLLFTAWEDQPLRSRPCSS